jgi:tetratricopeptide (TPR) repeat protein
MPLCRLPRVVPTPSPSLPSANMNLERVAIPFARWVWGVHFRIPESVYWLVLAAAVVATTVFGRNNTEILVGGLLSVVSVAGVIRWRWDRRRCRGSLVVARFFEGGDTRGHGEEAQRIVVDSLRTNLPPRLESAVQSISVVVGSDERRFATRLTRRLRAELLLYGRLAASPDGGWSVLPRVLQPISGEIGHWDYLTMDVTPARASFGPLVSPLPRQRRVLDEEYPFDFCNDLEGVIRGTAGQFAVLVGEFARAESLLRDAISRAPQSTIPQFDALRVALAWSMTDQGRHHDALTLLRDRARGDNPSAHLLRAFSNALDARARPGREDPDPRLRLESIEALRLAAANENDPERDITVYNLQGMLQGHGATIESIREGAALMDELLQSKTGYRKFWWIKRGKAEYLWGEANLAHQDGDEARAIKLRTESAKWVSRAIRARPRLWIVGFGVRPPFVKAVLFARSAILHRTAAWLHAAGGHKLRARWHGLRANLVRRAHIKSGLREFAGGNWAIAAGHFDLARVGDQDDLERTASVYFAVALRQLGDDQRAETVWRTALERDPDALQLRCHLAVASKSGGVHLPRGVPGTEPTEQRLVEARIQSFREHFTPAIVFPFERP